MVKVLLMSVLDGRWVTYPHGQWNWEWRLAVLLIERQSIERGGQFLG
jgi:hypothetical protein